MDVRHSPATTRSSVSVAPKMRNETLIYLALLLVLESVYGWALFAAPELREPARFIPFTALMLLHAGLHLIGPRLSPRRVWLPLYFVAQAALVFAINQMLSTTGAAYGLYLYLALAAQAIGLVENRPRLTTVVVAGYLALGVVNYVWLWGWATLPNFLFLAIPQVFFVLAFVVLFFRQVNTRKRTQELLHELEKAHRELEAAHHQLADYATRVEDLTLSAERQRLARELHDTLAQGLAGLILQLEAVDAQLARGRLERAQTIISQAMERVRITLADARRAIDDLRSTDAMPTDLCDAVRREAERFTTATGILCTLDLKPPAHIPEALREHALRAVAEGLTNIARHARASHAWVRLAQAGDSLEVVVRDDGAGFNPLEQDGRNGHNGLIGLRERARLVGGSLDVTSAPNQGATLTLRLPLKVETQAPKPMEPVERIHA